MAILPQPGTPAIPETKPGRKAPAVATGYNPPLMAAMRRAAILEDGASTRVAAQAEKDRGLYQRPPVGPVEYTEGNIKKSVNLTGPAGYNQRAIPVPGSPDDMSQEEYMQSMLKSEPKFRDKLRMAMSVPFQTFINQPTVNLDYPSLAHNMSNNLLALSVAKRQK